jgi:hypothetical protein
MNSTKLTLLLFASFTLLTSGCSSMRPPPADPAAWQGDKLPERTTDNGWYDALYYALYDLGTVFAQ